jgi:hypothetical protein
VSGNPRSVQGFPGDVENRSSSSSGRSAPSLSCRNQTFLDQLREERLTIFFTHLVKSLEEFSEKLISSRAELDRTVAWDVEPWGEDQYEGTFIRSDGSFAPRIEEIVLEHEVIAVTKLSQDRPGSLQPRPLDKVDLKLHKAGFGQTSISDEGRL